jgi:hypothetical protein
MWEIVIITRSRRMPASATQKNPVPDCGENLQTAFPATAAATVVQWPTLIVALMRVLRDVL